MTIAINAYHYAYISASIGTRKIKVRALKIPPKHNGNEFYFTHIGEAINKATPAYTKNIFKKDRTYRLMSKERHGPIQRL